MVTEIFEGAARTPPANVTHNDVHLYLEEITPCVWDDAHVLGCVELAIEVRIVPNLEDAWDRVIGIAVVAKFDCEGAASLEVHVRKATIVQLVQQATPTITSFTHATRYRGAVRQPQKGRRVVRGVEAGAAPRHDSIHRQAIARGLLSAAACTTSMDCVLATIREVLKGAPRGIPPWPITSRARAQTRAVVGTCVALTVDPTGHVQASFHELKLPPRCAFLHTKSPIID